MGHCREKSINVEPSQATYTQRTAMFATMTHWGHKRNGADHLTAYDLRRQASRLFLGRAAQIGECDVEPPLESEGSGLEIIVCAGGSGFGKTIIGWEHGNSGHKQGNM